MGTKRSVLVDEKGLPLAIVISGANTHDIKLLEETLDHIVVLRPEPDEEHHGAVPSTDSRSEAHKISPPALFSLALVSALDREHSCIRPNHPVLAVCPGL